MDIQNIQKNLLKAYNLCQEISKIEKDLDELETHFTTGKPHGPTTLGRVANDGEWETLRASVSRRLQNEKQALLREAAQLFKD